MDRILVFDLNSKITLYTNLGLDEIYNEPIGFTREVKSCRKFGYTARRQDVGPKVNAKFYVYMIDEPGVNDRIYIGVTAEEDPDVVKAQSILDIKPLVDIDDVLVGYKVWV